MNFLQNVVLILTSKEAVSQKN